jgi:PPOX class probable F420-dependent enzyme
VTAAEVERLGASRFVSLTTYRRDGTPVSSPIWVVQDGSRLLAWTGRGTGKVKRLRHTATVTVAPSSGRGRPRGAAVSGTARLLPDDELAYIKRLMAAKYRIGWPALRTLNAVVALARPRRPPTEQVGIEIIVG